MTARPPCAVGCWPCPKKSGAGWWPSALTCGRPSARWYSRCCPRPCWWPDHFHVIQDATRRLEETRRLEQSEAKTALPRWPLVKGQERLTPKQQAQLAALQQRYPATIRRPPPTAR